MSNNINTEAPVDKDTFSPQTESDIDEALSLGNISETARKLGEDQVYESDDERSQILAARQRRGKMIKRAGKGLLALGVGTSLVLGANAGLNALDDNGNKIPNGAEIDKNIFSISVVEGATFREGPHVKDGEDYNGVLEAPSAGTIVGESQTYVFDEFNNGRWYGVSTDWVRDTFGGELDDAQIQQLKDDADGIVWTNEQNVSSIQSVEDAHK
ncbi:MAG: hypothetical protein ABIP50_02265 [Candidatus Saccharimonadales bacterium]